MTEYRQLQQLTKTIRQLEGTSWFTAKAPQEKLEQQIKAVELKPSFTSLTKPIKVNLKEILKKG